MILKNKYFLTKVLANGNKAPRMNKPNIGPIKAPAIEIAA
jgi:hypothetical protein